MKIDEIDSQIIELLQEDSRMMLKEIASRVGVSIPTVRSRIKKLTEFGLIKKFTAIVDFEKVWGRVRVIIVANASGNDEALLDKLSGLKEVRHAYFISGEKELMLEVELDEIGELSNFIQEKLRTGLQISNFSTFVVTKVIKEDYASVIKPNTSLKFRCDFCGTMILGKPIVEYIDGGRYYFSGKECVQAFKERLRKVR